MKYYVYIKQDGLYYTEDIIITDEYKSQDKLSPYWWNVDTVFKSLKEAVSYSIKNFSNFNETYFSIKINLEDSYILKKDSIKPMLVEDYIKGIK